ncbi:MAG: hypothetical protein ACYC9K_00935 [Sulfuricaulis sp.]
MPSNPATETDAEGLSAEERAALAPDTDEQANLQAVLDDGGESEKAPAGDLAPDKPADEKPADDKGAAAKATADEEEPAAAAAEAAPEREAPFVPRADIAPVENYDTRMQELDAKRKDVVQKFKAGEIQLDEMMTARDEIDDERNTLRIQQTDYENTVKREEQYGMQLWASQVNSFQRQHPEYGLVKTEDGKGMVPANPAMYYALDGVVKQLGTDPKMIAEFGQDNLLYLEEAHKRIQAQLAVKPSAPKPTDKPAADPVKEALKGRKPDLTVVPKTVAGLPSASVPETGAPDEFAHLDKLDGMELEVAVARLTPDQQARYARG